MIKSDNYDLTTFEQFVYHSNKINYDLNRIEKITRKENSLNDFKIKFATELKEINEYLEWVEENKEHILLDNGSDYYDYLEAENYDWE